MGFSRLAAQGFVRLGAVLLLCPAPLAVAQQAARPTNPPRTQTPATNPPAAKLPTAQSPNMQQPAAQRPGEMAPSAARQPSATAANGPAPSAPPRAGAPAPAPGGAVRQPIRKVQHQQEMPRLTEAQEAELNHILAAWERESDKVKTLTAAFNVWEYDLAWAPPAVGQPPKPKRESKGEIHFAAPDKGSYEEADGGERWMCDGEAIYEFNRTQKKLKEYRLPEELKGKAITKGPLPFVFGAKADSMKSRYFMRVITPADVQNQIWIEAWPRHQQDAANFHHVQVILEAKLMLPVAIRLYQPNPQQFKVYSFESPKVNDAWDKIKAYFDQPRTPLGWQRVVEEAPVPPSATPPAGAANPAAPTAARPPAQTPTTAKPTQVPTADARNRPAQGPAAQQTPAKKR